MIPSYALCILSVVIGTSQLAEEAKEVFSNLYILSSLFSFIGETYRNNLKVILVSHCVYHSKNSLSHIIMLTLQLQKSQMLAELL